MATFNFSWKLRLSSVKLKFVVFILFSKLSLFDLHNVDCVFIELVRRTELNRAL